MPNFFLQLKELLAPGRVQIATVVYCANGSTIVELPGAGQVRVRGEAAVGAKVFIRYNRSGKGKLVIEYNSLDELDGILAHIQ